MSQDQTNNDREEELSGILKAIQGTGIIADGGLGKQCTVLLHETLARKKSVQGGVALETEQLQDVQEAGMWQAVQSAISSGYKNRADGLVYIIKDDEAKVSDMVRFTSAVEEMEPHQLEKTSLFVKETVKPNIWALEMRQLCEEHGIPVLTSVAGVRSHYA
jgi:hypothetical protein